MLTSVTVLSGLSSAVGEDPLDAPDGTTGCVIYTVDMEMDCPGLSVVFEAGKDAMSDG